MKKKFSTPEIKVIALKEQESICNASGTENLSFNAGGDAITGPSGKNKAGTATVSNDGTGDYGGWGLQW